MCHRCLKVAIIVSVSWANKGCEQVATHLVDLCWKSGFGSVWKSVQSPAHFSCHWLSNFLACAGQHVFYHTLLKSFWYIIQSIVTQSSFCMWRSCSALWTVLARGLLIEMRKWLGEKAQKRVVSWSSTITHQSPGGSLAKPWKKAWSFFSPSSCLELVCRLIMWHPPPHPTHNHWDRLESFPPFLMACICSWHMSQTNTVFSSHQL